MQKSKVVIALSSGMALAAGSAMAIPTEVSTAAADLATEVATYTGPFVVLATAVATAVIAVKWVKRFISRAT